MNSQRPKPAFEPNAYYERVLDLRRTDPKAFDSLAPVTKLALGQYEASSVFALLRFALLADRSTNSCQPCTE